MQLFVWIGWALLCLYLVITPALWATSLAARSAGRGAGLLARAGILVACLSAALAVALTVWQGAVTSTVLYYAPWRIPLVLVGVGAVTLWAFVCWSRLRTARLDEVVEVESSAANAIQRSLEDAGDALSLPTLPRLIVHRGTTSPAVIGVFRPTLLAPVYLAELDESSRMLVLAHELAHLKRGHLLWCGLSSILGRCVAPSGVGRASAKGMASLAEAEADRTLAELGFSVEEIRDTRSKVLQRMSAGIRVQAVAFTSADGQDSSVASRASLRTLFAGAVLCAVSAVAAWSPMVPRERPDLFGSTAAQEFVAHPDAGRFTGRVAQWVRSRYDIVFVRAGLLMRMRGDGTHLEVVTRKSASEPDVSRDGSFIVYLQGGQGSFDLYRHDTGAIHSVRLTQTEEEERQPSLSPDGKQVVYFTLEWDRIAGNYRSYDGHIMVRDLETGWTTSLFELIGPGIEASFGHDGTYLVFKNGSGLYRVGVDGSDKRQLTVGGAQPDGSWIEDHGAKVSPDGQSIVFTRVIQLPPQRISKDPLAGEANRATTVSVWVMQADGSGQRAVTKGIAGRFEQGTARFAPNGAWCAYQATETLGDAPRHTLAEVDLFTGRQRPLYPDEQAGWPSFTGIIR